MTILTVPPNETDQYKIVSVIRAVVSAANSLVDSISAFTLTLLPLTTAAAWKSALGIVTPGYVFIQSQTVSSPVASIDFLNLDSTYSEHIFSISNLLGSASPTAILTMQVSVNNGSSWVTSATYAFEFGYHLGSGGSGAPSVISFSGITSWQISSVIDSANTLDPFVAKIEMFNVGLTGTGGEIIWRATHFDIAGGQGMQWLYGTGAIGSNPINAVRFIMNTGNIAQGTITLTGASKT